MAKNKVFHYAFRVNYPGVLRELKTQVDIALPSILNPSHDKKFFRTFAIWDTGATCTVITSKVVEELGLLPTGKTNVSGLNSKKIKDTYIIDIGLPNHVLIRNINVIESEINSDDSQVLIGMDIIQKGDFAIANGTGQTIFSYCIPPHKNPIDLYEKSERVNPKRKP